MQLSGHRRASFHKDISTLDQQQETDDQVACRKNHFFHDNPSPIYTLIYSAAEDSSFITISCCYKAVSYLFQESFPSGIALSSQTQSRCMALVAII